MALASRLCGVHAQVASSAEMALGIRCPPVTRDTVRRALWETRTLVKIWAMRGTLHLLPAEELPMWVSALRARQQARRYTPAWVEYHGTTPDEAGEVTAAVGEVLPGRCLTREELASLVAERLGAPHLEEKIRSGWGALLKPAAYTGLLCFGPDRGRNVTFVSPRSWLGTDWNEPDPDTALAEVLRRFLDAYGPATSDDFARWWGTEPRPARQLLQYHAGRLAPVDLDGAEAWLTPQGAQAMRGAGRPRGVRLLPGFDPYVVAPHGHRRHLIPEGCLPRVSRTSGWISPVLLVDGRIAGVWRHDRRRGRVDLRIEPFAPPSRRVKAAAEAHAAEYERLLGGPVEVSWA